MAWRDTLIELRDELAEVRAQRQQLAAAEEAQMQAARNDLSSLADSLGIAELLSQMNATLLEGQGDVETIVSWDSGLDYAEADDDGDVVGPGDDEDDDIITAVLSCDEDGEREIAVEVVLAEGGISLQVNGIEIRPERNALQHALVEAFRDELEL